MTDNRVQYTTEDICVFGLIYLLIPALFFNLLFLKWHISLLCLSFFFLVVFYLKSNLSVKFQFRKISVFQFLLALLFTVSTGAGGFLYQSPDFAEKHNPIMKSLITEIWPIMYSVNINQMQIEGPMVYYIAFYIPGVILGKIGGWFLANVCLVFWQAFGTFICFKLLDSIVPGKWFFKTLFFLLFGGMDVVGYFFRFGHIGSWTMHLEWWAEFFQFPSMISAMHPSPQHTLPGWILGLSLISLARGKVRIEIIVCQILASLFWSPFVFLACSLLLLFNLNFAGLKQCLSAFIVYLVFFFLLPQFLYIGSTKAQVVKMFIWDEPTFIWWVYPVFIILEIGLWLYLAFSGFNLRKNHGLSINFSQLDTLNRDMKLFYSSLVLLLAFPVFVIGRYSDLCMRGTMPALVILSVYSYEFLYLKSLELQMPKWSWSLWKMLSAFNTQLKIRHLRFQFCVLGICLYFSWFNAYRELVRSIVVGIVRGPSIVKLENVRTIYELESDLVVQYIGNRESFFFKYMSK